MNVTLKLNAIIKALENIDSASLHSLCDDLIYAGALVPDLKHKSIQPAGWNPSKHHTIPSPADSIIELDDGLCVLEYSRQEDWSGKLKKDVASIKRWVKSESYNLVRFVFVTTRDIGIKKIRGSTGKKLTPKKFIEQEFANFDIQAFVFGQKDLLVPLQNSNYFYIRRKWLKMPEDYFQSLESFESAHIKRSQRRHIYLQKFVEDSSRQKDINALEEFIEKADATLLLIHAYGGIGKTRFVLETLKRLNERTTNIDILLNQGKHSVDVDEVIPEISQDRKSLIVLDDAHLIDNLRDFEKILIDRDYAKLILITRSTAQESVKQRINCPAEELELTPLDRESSIELLKSNLEYPLRDQYLRHLGRICEGNPLLIGLASHLINTGAVQTFGDLKTDDLVRKYCHGILAELRNNDRVDCDLYEPYLALLFLLKPFDISDAETRLLIRSLIKIEETPEVHLLRGLEQCGILEHHGNTLWLYPDLLGEYLVTSVFFCDIPFRSFNEIFSNIPSSNREGVFKTLRELDNAHANRFLKGWARDLTTDVVPQNNDERSDNLRLLEIITPIVPDETLEIVDYLLKPESEKPPKVPENMWPLTPQEHRDVLSQCLRILESPDLKCRNFDETLEKLLAMHFYKPEVEEYSTLRKEAFKAVVSVAAYDLNLWYQGFGYSIQTKMLKKAKKWKLCDLELYLPLILGVCRNLLQSEMRSEYADSEGIGWSEKPVSVTDDLIGLRKDVISLLQLIFDEVQAPKQIEVIRVLNCATEFPELGDLGEDMITLIRENAEVLFDFYLGLLTVPTAPNVEVHLAIEEQIHRLRAWHQGDIKNLDQLLSALQSNECYQLYRTLAGDTSLFWIDDGKSYDEIQTETADKIKKIADEITHENLMEWLETLNEIAESFPYTSDQDTSRFRQLLFKIGKTKPHIAQALIDKSLSKDNALKAFAAEFIRGIRKSIHPDIAGNYVREWLSCEDQTLLLQIPQTYRRVDEKSLDAGDVKIFETLQRRKMEDKQRRYELDRHIMSNIDWVYKISPEKMRGVICQLLKRSDQNNLNHHLEQLRWSREQIDLSRWDLSVFEDLLQTFVDIPVLNDNAVYILAQYGQKAPLELVPFFERRVAKQKQFKADSFPGYHAIPRRLKAIAETYQDHPQYVDVLKQILGWFQKHDYKYDTAAAKLISGIAPKLGGPLKQTLMEFIKSGDKEKILAVMKVLEKFPEDSVSDELCMQAVKHAEGQNELRDQIESIIVNRVPVSWGLDGAVTTFQNLKERVIPWCEDEDHHVRAFAQRIIPKIESRIEFEKECAAEDKIKRQKGLR